MHSLFMHLFRSCARCYLTHSLTNNILLNNWETTTMVQQTVSQMHCHTGNINSNFTSFCLTWKTICDTFVFQLDIIYNRVLPVLVQHKKLLPTHTHHAHKVGPEKLVISSKEGMIYRQAAGPFDEDQDVAIKCSAFGGKPGSWALFYHLLSLSFFFAQPH